MKFKHLTLTVVVVLACVVASMAQQASEIEARHLVTINVKKGEPIKGKFIGADADSVQVDIGSARAMVKLDDIVSIVFSTKSTEIDQPTSSSAVKQSVLDAVKALRKLDGATQVGVTFPQYGPLLIEAKSSVDEALADLPEGELKREILAAMEDYVIAGQAWSESLRSPEATGVPTGSALASMLNERYSLGLKLKRGSYLDRNMILEIIWKSASTHVDHAAALIHP